MNLEILSALTGFDVKDSSSVIKKGWQGTDPFLTGCLIQTDDVFSICSGVVIDVGKDDKNNLYTVTVEYDFQTWIRYCLLEVCDVTFGDEVSEGDKIGETYKSELRFEYCTDEVSEFPARTGNRELYKHDPMPILAGEILLPEIDDIGDIVAEGEDDFIVYIDEDTDDGEVE